MATIFLSVGLCNTTRNKFREYLVHVNESNLHLRCYIFIANCFFSLTKNTNLHFKNKWLKYRQVSCTLSATFIRYSFKSKPLDGFVKFRKATISFVMSLRPSIRLSARKEQLGSQWTDFHEIWYLRICRKSVEKIQVSLSSYKNNSYFKWSPMYRTFMIK